MEQKELLRKIKNALEKKMKVHKIYLFGSRARGTFYPDSDYDLAVISEDFKTHTFLERQKLVRPIMRTILGIVSLDVVCYTPEEYSRGKTAFLPSIIEKEGISV